MSSRGAWLSKSHNRSRRGDRPVVEGHRNRLDGRRVTRQNARRFAGRQIPYQHRAVGIASQMYAVGSERDAFRPDGGKSVGPDPNHGIEHQHTTLGRQSGLLGDLAPTADGQVIAIGG